MTPEEFVAKLKSFKFKLNKQYLAQKGQEIVQELKARTQSGIGISKDGNEIPFKPLKSSTVEDRRHFKKLDKRTTPETSNQIRSGQLVDGIHFTIKGDDLEIKPGTRRRDGIDSQDIARGQEEDGRVIFKLSNEQKKKLENELKQQVTQQLNKLLK